MSKSLGSQLPSDLLQFLCSTGPEEKFRRVILFATSDEDGWPRHGMLSAYELVAKDARHLLMLLYRDSQNTRNLERTGKCSLIVVDAEMSYYVCCGARPIAPIPEAPRERLFALQVEGVLEDVLPTARILSGITFAGYDPGMTRENRRLVFSKLRTMNWPEERPDCDPRLILGP